jgi:hypothetical protein
MVCKRRSCRKQAIVVREGSLIGRRLQTNSAYAAGSMLRASWRLTSFTHVETG